MTQVDQLSQEVDPSRPWLVWPAKDDREKIKVVGWHSSEDGKGLTFRGMTQEEVDVVESMSRSCCFIAVINGRLHAWSRFEDLPKVEPDPLMHEHWDGKGEVVQHDFTEEKTWSPTLYLHHILDRASEQMAEDYGFVRMRSRRDLNGGYWETWMLHLWAAKGRLKTFIEEQKKNGVKDVGLGEKACRFIVGTGLRFGSLDLSAQRWALVID